MNILAIDTSTKKANVCLKYNDTVINKSIDNEITHSEKLLPLVDEVLRTNGVTLKDLNYLACSAGPGSFTGIRIGIATVKAFAKSYNIPVFNVSSLDILAYTNTSSDYVISIMDAKNSRIYYSVYKVIKDKNAPYLDKICDYSNDLIDIALENIVSVLANEKNVGSINVIGDCIELYKNEFINKFTNICENISTCNEHLDANTLITMLTNYILLGKESDYIQNYLTLDAIYVRPSQAERAKNNEL